MTTNVNTGTDAETEETGGTWDWINGLGGDGDWGDWGDSIGPLLSGLGANYITNKGWGGPSIDQAGYQGSIPEYTYDREMIQQPNDPNRRAGSSGRRYFTDGSFNEAGIAGIQPNPNDPPPSTIVAPTDGDDPDNQYAEGGIASAKEGRYLRGESDGMEDAIDTTIDDKEAAALSHGEFIIPADVVSHLGNGNSDAGAKMLEQMMGRIRKERTGNEKQGKEIDASQFLPQ